MVSTIAFWKQSGHIYQMENPRDPNSTTGRTREALQNKLTWVFALFIFGYVGAEGPSLVPLSYPNFVTNKYKLVSLGGWIITFMTKVRSASAFSSGIASTGFWAGMTVGRISLSFLTARLGEFRSVILYLALSLALELLFWLVPSFVVSAVAVAFLGLCLGPLFPTTIVLLTKLLPRHLHVGSVGFATAFGGSGGAIFPFIVGAIAQARGVKSLQPVILGLLGAISALWLLLPRGGRRDHDESRERIHVST